MLASRLCWLKHYCNSEPSLWKKLFKLNLSELGVDLDVLLHCNFAEENVDITKLQPFYQDLVKSWISVNGAGKKPLSEQCIWYNKNITISTTNVMSPGLYKSGLRFCSEPSNFVANLPVANLPCGEPSCIQFNPSKYSVFRVKRPRAKKIASDYPI